MSVLPFRQDIFGVGRVLVLEERRDSGDPEELEELRSRPLEGVAFKSVVQDFPSKDVSSSGVQCIALVYQMVRGFLALLAESAEGFRSILFPSRLHNPAMFS